MKSAKETSIKEAFEALQQNDTDSAYKYFVL